MITNKSAALHPHEKQRLQALYSTDLLDTLPEESFDRVTSLAALICEAPIALISLVDLDRQWFKSKVGLSSQETPRSSSFCAHALLQDDVFVVENTHADERFKDNPLVIGETNIQFYAGSPLLDPVTSLPLGTLCVIDHFPRKINEKQIKTLAALAKQISCLIDLRIQLSKVQVQNEKLKFHGTAIQNMEEGLLIQDSMGKIIECNFSAAKILGIKKEKLKGKSPHDFIWNVIHQDGSPFAVDDHPAMVALRTGKSYMNILMGVKNSDGNVRWISVSANPVFAEKCIKPTHVVSTFKDVTDLLIVQEKLIENSRLVSIAEMSSGVAHEINNPLAIIGGICSGAVRAIDHNNMSELDLRLAFEKIKDTVVRITKIVKGLQSFSRDVTAEPNMSVNIGEVIDDALIVCADKFKQNQISVKVIGEKNVFIEGNFIKLAQVFLNLLTNSCDAIIDQKEKWITIEFESLTDKLLLTIADSGPGISDAIAKKMFLPFFTTKEVGKGTGLGLSISKRLIEGMGGNMNFKVQDGHTAFVLELKRK